MTSYSRWITRPIDDLTIAYYIISWNGNRVVSNTPSKMINNWKIRKFVDKLRQKKKKKKLNANIRNIDLWLCDGITVMVLHNTNEFDLRVNFSMEFVHIFISGIISTINIRKIFFNVITWVRECRTYKFGEKKKNRIQLNERKRNCCQVPSFPIKCEKLNK